MSPNTWGRAPAFSRLVLLAKLGRDLHCDVVVCGGYVQYWLPDVSPWLPALLTLGFLCLFNMLSVKMFGEAEFWFAMIKVVAIVALIATGAWMVFSGWTSPDA